MGRSVKVDISDANRMMEGMKLRHIEKAVRSGMRATAGIVRRGVARQLVVTLGGDRGASGKRNWKEREPGIGNNGTVYPPLKKDIKLAVYRRGAIGANVSLLPMKGRHRSHVLLFLNQGTKLRTGKTGKGKPHSRGRITASGFFDRGVQATGAKAEKKMAENVNKAIMKEYKKHKG